MRYTRYEYKKSNKMKFICTIVVIVGVSIAGGLYASNLVFKGKQIADNKNGVSYTNDQNATGVGTNIIALQCGYYSKEENAQASLNTISSYCQPFIAEENGNFRVLAGIYEENDGNKKIDELKSKGIDVAKVSFNISTNTIEDKKLVEIVDGFLKITSKLEDSEVKSVKTQEYKTWADNIINEGATTKSEKLDSLSNCINNLPDEIDKKNSVESIKALYNLMKA